MSAYTSWTVELETSGLTLNANPLIETSAGDWTGINGATVGRSTTVSRQGSASLQVNGNGVTGTPSARSVAGAAVTVGNTYNGSIWAYSPTGWATGAQAVIDWRDAGNTSTVSSAIPTATALPAGVWTQLTVSGTCPVGAALALLRFRIMGTPAAATAFYGDELRLMNPAASWLDITQYVHTVHSPIRITYGRADELSQITPATCTIALEDPDHRFLPGNQASPLWPTIRKGTRVRVSTTANATTFRRHLGYISDVQPDPIGDVGLYQTVQITTVDRLARLGSMPVLQSPLYQEVLANQSSGLLAYYPLTDDAAATRSEDATGQRHALLRQRGLRVSSPPDPMSQGSLTYAAGDGPPHGGGTAPLWVPRASTTTRYESGYYLRSDDSGNPYTAATGETITLQAWVHPQEMVDHEVSYSEIIMALDSAGGTGAPASDPVLIMYHTRGTSEPPDHGVRIFLQAYPWNQVPFDLFNVLPINQLSLVAVKLTLGSTSTVKVWINGTEYSGTMPTNVGTYPGSVSWNRLVVGANAFSGSVSHVQLYKGTSYTLAKHQAQAVVGRAGLEGQTTSARINTAATYAGLTAPELSLESGQSTMGATSWSSATPYDAMHEAEQAEGGILYARGDGVLVFHARGHRRNDDGSVTSIPKAWLSGDLEIRADDPINDATVSRSGGSTARSVDTASVASYGTYATSQSIAVASDSELAYRAQWLTYAYAQPRVRAPQVALDLTWRSDAERATVLALDVSSRIALTDLPATFPPDVSALYVEGWAEEIGVTGHRITLNCSPVIGSVPGRSDVWWQIGDATRGKIDSVYVLAP